MNRKKDNVITLATLVVILIAAWITGSINNLNRLENVTQSSWIQVQSLLKRQVNHIQNTETIAVYSPDQVGSLQQKLVQLAPKMSDKQHQSLNDLNVAIRQYNADVSLLTETQTQIPERWLAGWSSSKTFKPVPHHQ